MSTRRVLAALWGALVLHALVACRSSEPARSVQLDARPSASRVRPARPDEYLVRFVGVPSDSTVDQAASEAGLKVVRRLDLVPGLYHVRSTRTLQELQQILGDSVEAVRPNRLLFSTAAEAPFGALPAQASVPLLPNDPLFALQWGLRNVGQDLGGQSGSSGADVHATLGWPVATGTLVVVAVLDSGIDVTHPDLAPNLWVNEIEQAGMTGDDDDHNGYVDDVSGWSFVEGATYAGGEPGSPSVDDTSGHGTEVASILGARGNNGLGMSGVAWNCRLMPLRIFERTSDGLVTDVATAIAALQYAVRNGAKVSSNSWGCYSTALDAQELQDLSDAIEIAGAAGHLFVAAAGNGIGNVGSDDDAIPFYPASFPLANIVSVTGTDYADELPANFNYGATSVDLAAPGMHVVTADLAGHTYKFVSAGTSYATPYVAGAAALVWGHPSASNWPLQRVRDRLLQTVRPLPSLSGKVASGGVLDLGALLQGLSAEPPQPPDDPLPADPLPVDTIEASGSR